MKAIHIRNRFQIYDDSLKTYDNLPAQIYAVRFSKMEGFYLEKHADIEVKEEKIYGVHPRKVDKVINSFGKMERNLGVILSGEKGIGKSLFAKLLAIKAVEIGMPVIIVDKFFPDIASYIAQIDQPVMVLFDEFDKTFSDVRQGDGEAEPQASLLTLFDGIEQGKKLFVITCNRITKLNDYLVNRTGRFHYHFRFEYPSSEEITEYLTDKILPEYHSEIKNIVSFAHKVDLTYDSLRAIAFEINSGESFKDAIKDLNIMHVDDEIYNVTLRYTNGEVASERLCIDVFDANQKTARWYDIEKSDDCVYVTFYNRNLIYQPDINGYIVPPEYITLDYGSEEGEAKYADYIVSHLEVIKVRSPSYHYELL